METFHDMFERRLNLKKSNPRVKSVDINRVLSLLLWLTCDPCCTTRGERWQQDNNLIPSLGQALVASIYRASQNYMYDELTAFYWVTSKWEVISFALFTSSATSVPGTFLNIQRWWVASQRSLSQAVPSSFLSWPRKLNKSHGLRVPLSVSLSSF